MKGCWLAAGSVTAKCFALGDSLPALAGPHASAIVAFVRAAQASGGTLRTCRAMAQRKPAFAELLLPHAFADLATQPTNGATALQLGGLISQELLPRLHRHPKAARLLLACLNHLRSQWLDAKLAGGGGGSGGKGKGKAAAAAVAGSSSVAAEVQLWRKVGPCGERGWQGGCWHSAPSSVRTHMHVPAYPHAAPTCCVPSPAHMSRWCIPPSLSLAGVLGGGGLSGAVGSCGPLRRLLHRPALHRGLAGKCRSRMLCTALKRVLHIRNEHLHAHTHVARSVCTALPCLQPVLGWVQSAGILTRHGCACNSLLSRLPDQARLCVQPLLLA